MIVTSSLSYPKWLLVVLTTIQIVILMTMTGNNNNNAVVVVEAAIPKTNKQTARDIKILNESGSRVEVYWIHPQTRAASLMSSPNVMNGASFPLNSFAGHEFEIRELPSATTGVCKGEDQVCRSAYFAVSENDDQGESS
jgi:hypothetical protein